MKYWLLAIPIAIGTPKPGIAQKYLIRRHLSPMLSGWIMRFCSRKMRDQNDFDFLGFEGKGALWRILSSSYPENGDLKYSCIHNQHPVFQVLRIRGKNCVFLCFWDFVANILRQIAKLMPARKKRNCHVKSHLPKTEAVFMNNFNQNPPNTGISAAGWPERLTCQWKYLIVPII